MRNLLLIKYCKRNESKKINFINFYIKIIHFHSKNANIIRYIFKYYLNTINFHSENHLNKTQTLNNSFIKQYNEIKDSFILTNSICFFFNRS